MSAAVLTTNQDLSKRGISTYDDRDTFLSRRIIASPYLEESHLLDLTTLDDQSRLLALALSDLTTATRDYAIAAYEKAIDLEGLMSSLRTLVIAEGSRWTEQSFYVVEFRSTLKAGIDRDLLFTLDQKSHEEATQSGGLLKYWYGEPDAERRNLATCFWRNKDDAIKGGSGPWHKKARAIVPQIYQHIKVTGLLLTIKDDVLGWTLETAV
ncbi:hypothetical protein EPUS_05840 [Endocarpon pusillum Z07020]|uniref:Uncharacterized protein n=1 Tax=Endocarpon pusillum (strain Z07020 / HMAS-L-300199) TaxID=1263415 RepID=U1GFZ0_ENDPU|nr:uncharacterized protein EPUS_05840 [Endocarpon pusillum Z07020]ERF76567.1 hypothetical protein EPUS_05840 [Endocarpon pusillum Z07020]